VSLAALRRARSVAGRGCRCRYGFPADIGHDSTECRLKSLGRRDPLCTQTEGRGVTCGLFHLGLHRVKPRVFVVIVVAAAGAAGACRYEAARDLLVQVHERRQQVHKDVPCAPVVQPSLEVVAEECGRGLIGHAAQVDKDNRRHHKNPTLFFFLFSFFFFLFGTFTVI